MSKKTIGTIAISIAVTLIIVYTPKLLRDYKTHAIDSEGIKYCESVNWENVEIFDYWGSSREYKEKRIQWFSNMTEFDYQLIAGDYVLDQTGTEESQKVLKSFLKWEEQKHFPPNETFLGVPLG